MIEVDGSYLEGGGAILRVATALSAITGKPVRVFNVRAGRSKPGLMTQHLESLKAVALLCSGRLDNAFTGSTEIEMHPGRIQPRDISVTIATAGAIGLLFQSVSAPICLADTDVRVSILGGATFARWAPPLPAIQRVLLPLLESMGYPAELEIARHGFFPKGGARVKITGHPSRYRRPLVLTEPGEASIVRGISVASTHLQKAQVADRQARAAGQTLGQAGLKAQVEREYVDAVCPGSGIVLWAETGARAIIGGDSIGERGKPSEQVGEEAANALIETVRSGAAVDEHLSDQLLLFMALAKGRSVITTPRLTGHAKTNMHVIKQFLPVEFEVKEDALVRIECSGSVN
ncbi:MAG: RNA 3'-terminal phosphate cyclase [Candidatus Abyssobacteria bacterium SURF_5]|jgi:RNA 3'-phosphate cyclase|uniref:RNA 3'-terminal phosphate cyclase n=1 Tax=Abyssobacteria bacterium (strain SURF_5) TaxID=2093360 RepID=A0A3A4P1E8_ABYX5|nr:MAG: RNA 3'-terminal phosphate cyclase [Candidatus Abyssubacteria bacterium SURF_5]